MLGPSTTTYPCSIYSSAVSVDPDEYYAPNGFKTENFTFTAMWANELVPDSINLCLIPANRSISSGIGNTFGINKFEMETTESSPDYLADVEYKVVLNFSDLGFDDCELGHFSHYFEVIMQDGNVSYFFSEEFTYDHENEYFQECGISAEGKDPAG